MQGISNKYIEQFMSRFKIDFKGVFASDEIPFFPGSNFSLICNLSKKNDKGSHFVAIYVLSKTIIYFDSFGMKCYVHSICKYLHGYNKKIVQSLITVQHPLSLHCGYFSIGFILALECNLSLSLYQNMFSSVYLFQNDEIVCNFIVKLLKIKNLSII